MNFEALNLAEEREEMLAREREIAESSRRAFSNSTSKKTVNLPALDSKKPLPLS